VIALIVALVIIGWLLVYKVRHPHTDVDLEKARLDSVTRSRSVVSGKVQEHLAPLFPEFLSQFNPRDARFIGSPLDFVVFDGLDEGEVRNVVFIEVKTAKASLTKRERCVRDALEARRVQYQLLRLPSTQAALEAVADEALPTCAGVGVGGSTSSAQ
jgi:predicted Holliday junction resolvase-like endonuclease